MVAHRIRRAPIPIEKDLHLLRQMAASMASQGNCIKSCLQTMSYRRGCLLWEKTGIVLPFCARDASRTQSKFIGAVFHDKRPSGSWQMRP
jgi:hypothetical protein